MIEDFRHIEAQLDAFPPSAQKSVLERYTGSIRGNIGGAPTGCFTDQQRIAVEMLADYLSETPSAQLTTQRIQELMGATGLPHPTPVP